MQAVLPALPHRRRCARRTRGGNSSTRSVRVADADLIFEMIVSALRLAFGAREPGRPQSPRNARAEGDASTRFQTCSRPTAPLGRPRSSVRHATRTVDPLYDQDRAGRPAGLAEREWMVITGGRPRDHGGRDRGRGGLTNSFGVRYQASVSKPRPSQFSSTATPKLVVFPLLLPRASSRFIKEADGFVLLPGGFRPRSTRHSSY